MAKSILFLSKGINASSTRYRAIDFFPLFKQAGWQPEHLTVRSTPAGRLQLLRAAKKADAVIIVRRTFGRLFAQILRRCSRQLVFTFDDAIFAKSDGTHSSGRERRFASTIPLCDHIWAGNSYLADSARQFNNNVTVIPTAVDVDKYAIQAAKPSSKIDLVWIGSSSTKKHLITALPALEAAAAQVPVLRLKIIADFCLESEKLEIIPIPWASETEARELASSHIGIAPLPDNPFTRGKCGLKVLQYMAAGLPVISSPTGVNKDMVTSGVTGFLAESDEEWVAAIAKLAESPELRDTMGAAGRQKCLDHFTLQAVFQKMLATLEAPPKKTGPSSSSV